MEDQEIKNTQKDFENSVIGDAGRFEKFCRLVAIIILTAVAAGVILYLKYGRG